MKAIEWREAPAFPKYEVSRAGDVRLRDRGDGRPGPILRNSGGWVTMRHEGKKLDVRVTVDGGDVQLHATSRTGWLHSAGADFQIQAYADPVGPPVVTLTDP